MSILLKNGSVYGIDGFSAVDMAIENGIISAVGQSIAPDGFDGVFDCSDMYIIPGLADVHVHLRQPGFSYKETIASGTAAAAHGGYTDVCSMPNLAPCPDSVEHIKEQLDIINKDALINVHPYASITVGEKGERLSDLEGLAPLAVGFSDDGKGVQNRDMMLEAMKRAKALGKVIAAHCEDESLLHGGYIHDGVYAAEHGHRGICSESEWKPIERDIELIRQTGCRYHVCHVSTAESVELIRAAKAEGLPITCETAPHYLLLSDRDITEDDAYGDKGGRFKMNPPLRSEKDRAAVLEGIKDGTIDVIATDHAPHSAEEKSRGLEKSLMGVVGLETAFDMLYTYLVLSGHITLEHLVKLMAVEPRRIFNDRFDPNGLLQTGGSADIAVVKPLESERRIAPEDFLSMGRSTPFAGRTVRSSIYMTICGGRIVWNEKNN